jgi:NADH:ubiquinone oxidoreductase subunit
MRVPLCARTTRCAVGVRVRSRHVESCRVVMRGLDTLWAQWHQRAMSIKTFVSRIFTWWNGQTFGTQVWTALYGEFVGEDVRGNRYYRTKGGKIDPYLGFDRRWVIFNGYTDPTAIGDWHGWMHHLTDTPPTQEKVAPRPWEKPHVPNMTGTPLAYRPPGSTLAEARRPEATGDYQAWRPDH